MRTTDLATRLRTLFLAAALALSAVLPAAATAAVLHRDGDAAVVRASVVVQRDGRDAWFATAAAAGSPRVADVTEWWREARAAAIEQAVAHRAAAEAAAQATVAEPARAAAKAPSRAAVAAAARQRAPRPSSTKPPSNGPSYAGRDRMWIPALGMNRSVSVFSCTRSTPPANYVYRWGCAGRNNVYLFGHAWGVMKPLHDAYYGHRLKVGMRVVYADGSGRVRTYAVTTWRVVSPTNVSWAIAAQSRPSMTLQTCVGANSEYRLLVRLVAVS